LIKTIIVSTSFFPSSDEDQVPAFVKDQIVSIKKMRPNLHFFVLTPHNAYGTSFKSGHGRNVHYEEFRFHYFWPFQFEKLAGRGIMPTLKRYPFYYFLIPFFFLGQLLALYRLTLKTQPDMIYAHWFLPQAITAGIVSWLTNVPFVYTTHSSDVALLRHVPVLGPWIVRYFSRKASAITAVSRRSLDRLRAFFTEEQWNKVKDRVAIIPMGVDVGTLPPEVFQVQKDRQQVLFIGRLVEKKGLQYLLPSFFEISKDNPNVKLTIAGNGPLFEDIQKKARDLNINSDQIEFIGFVSGDAKKRLIASADVFVVPSIIATDGDAEGLPVSLLEGLAAGKVCVATYESGADDILEDDRNGFLIPQKDVFALAKALRHALELSPEKREEMEANAVRTAKRFLWSNIAERYFDFLFK
jgi:glycosyltransferase involved in cell wall biosynthesis